MSDILSKVFDPDHIDPQTARRAEWAVVLKGAVLFTALACQAKDTAKAVQGHDIIAKARDYSGLDSAILSAIFGGEVPPVPENRLMAAIVEAGKTATAEELKAARAVMAVWRKAEETAKAERMAKAKAVRAKENLVFWARTEAAVAATAARRDADVKTVTFTAGFTQEEGEILSTGVKVGLIGYAKKKANFYELAELARHYAKTLGLPSNAGALPVRFRSEVRGFATYAVDETLLGDIKQALAIENAAQEALAAEKAKAEKEGRLAALVAAGAIIIDGILLTEDGKEIKLEDI
jgi:hypothetical protein